MHSYLTTESILDATTADTLHVIGIKACGMMGMVAKRKFPRLAYTLYKDEIGEPLKLANTFIWEEEGVGTCLVCVASSGPYREVSVDHLHSFLMEAVEVAVVNSLDTIAYIDLCIDPSNAAIKAALYHYLLDTWEGEDNFLNHKYYLG